jgi:hypothetical protein
MRKGREVPVKFGGYNPILRQTDTLYNSFTHIYNKKSYMLLNDDFVYNAHQYGIGIPKRQIINTTQSIVSKLRGKFLKFIKT